MNKGERIQVNMFYLDEDRHTKDDITLARGPGSEKVVRRG
jgi:hypothetical protein